MVELRKKGEIIGQVMRRSSEAEVKEPAGRRVSIMGWRVAAFGEKNVPRLLAPSSV